MSDPWVDQLAAAEERLAEALATVETLEQRVAELEALLDDEAHEVWAAVRERAKKGDVAAAKLYSEELRRRKLEGEARGALTINDLVVPAGTIVDRDRLP